MIGRQYCSEAIKSGADLEGLDKFECLAIRRGAVLYVRWEEGLLLYFNFC